MRSLFNVLRFIYLGNHKNHPHLFVLINLLLIVMSNIAVAQDDLDINEMRSNAQRFPKRLLKIF
jgi:hypothetical protein